MYVGIPRTVVTYDLQKTQHRYNAWEDYNPSATATFTSTRYKTEVSDGVSGATANAGAFTWSEGLAKAAHYKNDKWLWCKRYHKCFNNQY